MNGPLLQVQNLTVTFPTEAGELAAVRGLSYHVAPGEVVAMVGESGSGKSAAAMAVIGLLPEYAEVSGSVRLGGAELLGMSDADLSRIRGARIGTVFQDPMSALTPVYTVGDQIAEAITVHHRQVSKAEARRRAVELMDLVGIDRAETRARSFPHELSGGERQRVVIAIAISCDPDLIICDEPTTALDVTVQAQILELIKKMQRELNMAVIFITHDLGVVSGLCDRVQVMYAGRIVESGETRSLFYETKHPYTRALQRSIPSLQKKGGTLFTIPGMPPDLSKPIPGCSFAARCEHAGEICQNQSPQLAIIKTGHSQSCLRVQAGEI